MPQTALTSALNATIITGNGNEGLLLNDMGNTLIKDSITGNIMSLSNGFIPLGMKEHGGILYIASYNPQTKKGELGTIPSPIIAYTYNKSEEDKNLVISDILRDKLDDEILIDLRVYTSPIYVLSDLIFHAGDKFIVILNLQYEIESLFKRYLYKHTWNQAYGSKYIEDLLRSKSFPIISNNDEGRGWLKIKLYALSSSASPVELTTITNNNQEYYTSEGYKKSKYWFVDSNTFSGDEQFNLNKTRTSNLFRTFPNIKSSKLAILFEIEKPNRLEYLFNKQYLKNLPLLIYIKKQVGEETKFEYYAAIHGFQYDNGLCAIRPDKIKIESLNHDIHFTAYNLGMASINPMGQREIILYPIDKLNPKLYTLDPTSELQTESSRPPKRSPNYNQAFLSVKEGTTDTFIISKYRPCSLEFNNYDTNNNDALFFVKLDSLDSDVILKVTVYTKQYFKELNESDTYVKYDSYNLTKFNPIKEELAISNLIPETATQQLFIEKDGQENYDIELFNNVEEGKNACFLYDSITDRMQKFDTDNRKYVDFNRINYVFKNNETEIDWDQTTSEDNDFYTIEEYAALKTWIYPITTLNNDSANDDSTSIERRTRDEDYWFLTQNVPHYKAKQYLGGDKLPTYKLPCLPEVHLQNGMVKHYLLPLRHYTDTEPYDIGKLNSDIIDSYERAGLAKEQALSYINQYGLKTEDLKKYSLFQTNLTCLYKNFGDFPLEPNYSLLRSNHNIVNGESPIDEDFFKLSAADNGGGELNIWREHNQPIISYKYLPRSTFTQLNEIHGWSGEETRYWQMTLDSNPWGTVIGKPGLCFRPYASSMVAKPHYVNYLGALDENDLLSHPASFLTFLVKSSPGFIHCDNKQHDILNLEVINYNHPVKYLYKKDFYLNIENKGRSAVTTYYSKYAHSGDGWSSGWIQDTTLQNGTSLRGYQFNFFTTSCVKIDDELKETILLGNDSFSELQLNYFHEYNDLKVNNVLGVFQGSTLIQIPNNSQCFELKTKGTVRPTDECGDYYPSDDIEDSVCKVVSGWGYNSIGTAMVVPLEDSYTTNQSMHTWAWWGRQIAATNVLTSLRCLLFVDKATSDLQYTNKSDFSINYLLELDLNRGIWCGSGYPIFQETNVIVENNLLNLNAGEKETMADFGLLSVDDDNNPITANGILTNSFLNDTGYYVLESGESTISLGLNITIHKGLYILNINYAECETMDLQLLITTSEGQKQYNLYNREHLILFYTTAEQLSINDISLKISRNSLNMDESYSKFYIKNLGLYEVDLNSSNVVSQELKTKIDNLHLNSQNLTIFINESDLFKHIVLPIVFCFKELLYEGYSKYKVGCLDVEYQGFLALPDHGYQLIGGIYYLKKSDQTLAYYDKNTKPVEVNNDEFGDFITNNIFKLNNLKIRTND